MCISWGITKDFVLAWSKSVKLESPVISVEFNFAEEKEEKFSRPPEAPGPHALL